MWPQVLITIYTVPGLHNAQLETKTDRHSDTKDVNIQIDLNMDDEYPDIRCC